MEYRTMVLSALLDKYEKSAHFFGTAMKNRRIVFKISRETMPDYFSGEQPLLKTAFHQSAEELQAAGLVKLVWLRGEKGNLLKEIVLNLEELSRAYSLAGRTPRLEQLQGLRTLIVQAAEKIKTEWIREFLSHCARQIAEQRVVPPLLPPETSDTELLLKAFSGLDHKGDKEVPERVFSLRYLGGSKLLTGRVRGSLVAAARKYLFDDAETAAEDVLAELGIVRTSDEMLLAGPITLKLKGLTADLSALVFGAVADTQKLKETEVVGLATDQIILVENKTNFHELARRGHAERVLLLYLGGFPGPGKRLFLQVLHDFCVRNRPGAKFFHWGDIDMGGLRIHLLLKEKAVPGLIPLFMDSETLLKYREAGESLTPSYRSGLEKMKKDPAYAGFRDLIELMLALNIRLEQEALLAGEDLQLFSG